MTSSQAGYEIMLKKKSSVDLGHYALTVKSAFYPSPESADEVLRRHDGVHARPRSSASGARLLRAASYCLRVGWCDGLDCSHIWQPQMRGHW